MERINKAKGNRHTRELTPRRQEHTEEVSFFAPLRLCVSFSYSPRRHAGTLTPSRKAHAKTPRTPSGRNHKDTKGRKNGGTENAGTHECKGSPVWLPFGMAPAPHQAAIDAPSVAPVALLEGLGMRGFNWSCITSISSNLAYKTKINVQSESC